MNHSKKSKSRLSQRSLFSKKLLATLTTLTIVQSSLAVVTIHLEETSTGVTISFDGTLNLGTTNSLTSTTVNFPVPIPPVISANVDEFNVNSGDLTVADVGIISTSFITVSFQSTDITYASNPFSFGVASTIETIDTVAYSSDLIITPIDDDPATPLIIELDQASHSLTVANATLESIGLESVTTGQVLFTSDFNTPDGTTLDTIVFGDITAIPEPSSTTLLALAGISLATYRRRN